MINFPCSILLILTLIAHNLQAQPAEEKPDYLRMDVNGVMRWKKTGKEAAFFGVNYTVPFAYGYRSHKTLGTDLQQAIDNDVYHMARLGINAFRVHVWDTEISDSAGNLLNNEHLRLFDYLLSRLEERGIYILITPIAFWGNGYPEKDEKTGSFSNIYGKEQSVVNEKAILAQERYLSQFFKHLNPYTGKTYGKDPFVVATELNNEPKHSGPLQLTTAYINRLNRAVKSTGWNKPVFYNISESPAYAAAVAVSKVSGFSFQWYPTGLVAGHEQKGNFLPNVDRYHIPFDTIPAFLHKPRIIYEFDAADILQSYMYPAMARSFRTAGFQWAAQFAYDPMATAYANTEYQTHYLNLAYTPSKAISLMIAGEVFRSTPLFKSYGSYPADTSFTDFRLSYQENLSEMNRKDAFYYSNTTTTNPASAAALKHIAGVGKSPLINYGGSGAYFMDKLPDGNWRLEVMPDVQNISDPFAAASADKEVNKVIWNEHPINIRLPNLNAGFYIQGINKGNQLQAKAISSSFLVKPGTYLLSNQQTAADKSARIGSIRMDEFVAPADVSRSGESVTLFDPAKPTVNLIFYLGEWAYNQYTFVPARTDEKAMLKISHTPQKLKRNGGLEIYVKDLLRDQDDLSAYRFLVIDAGANVDLSLNVNLISGSAISYGHSVKPERQNHEIRIPLSALTPSPLLLLPRPYPGFEPLYFQSAATEKFNIAGIEKFQLSYQLPENTEGTIMIGKIRLER
jgi:hypothetical protein